MRQSGIRDIEPRFEPGQLELVAPCVADTPTKLRVRLPSASAPRAGDGPKAKDMIIELRRLDKQDEAPVRVQMPARTPGSSSAVEIALPPLAAGTLWTTALAALIYPRLSAIATAFAAVVIGVGVDTGVHVYGRLLAARREGRSPIESATIARRETWKPTLGAAVAAGAAFACLGLSDIAGMRQLGVLCAFGEVLTAVAILLVVPEVGAWLERGPPPSELRLPFVAALTATRPNWTLF